MCCCAATAELSGRIINIVVSPASGAGNKDSLRLLNYLTAPNVLVWSAALASCLGWGTRVLMADGTDRAVEDLQNGDQLVGENGQVVFVQNIAGQRHSPIPLAQPLYTVEQFAREGQHGADQGRFMDTFTCTGAHLLTVGNSNAAFGCTHRTRRRDGSENTYYYVRAWRKNVYVRPAAGGPSVQDDADPDGDRSMASVGFRNVRPAGSAFADWGSLAAANAGAAAWNVAHNLPRTSRMTDIQVDQPLGDKASRGFLQLNAQARKDAQAQKIRVPVSFTGEAAALQWLDAAVTAALDDVGAALAGAPLAPGFVLPPVAAGGATALDVRVEQLRNEWLAGPGAAPPALYAAASALRGANYWSPAIAAVPALAATAAGIPWPAHLRYVCPGAQQVAGVWVAPPGGWPRFPGSSGAPAAGAEQHEADFVMPPLALTPAAQRAAIKMFVLKHVLWAIGVWQTDGDGRRGDAVLQSAHSTTGSHRGVFERLRRFCELLGCGGLHRVVPRPHQRSPGPGGRYLEPGARIEFHLLGFLESSLLRRVLVRLQLYQLHVAPPAGWAAQQKAHMSDRNWPAAGAASTCTRLANLPPALRHGLLAGLLDGDGMLYTTHDCFDYRFCSELQPMARFVTFLARVSGLAANTPILHVSANIYWTNAIRANFDTQAAFLDLAIASKRTTQAHWYVPAGGVATHFRKEDPYSAAMVVKPPAAGAAARPFVRFQVSAAAGAAPLPRHQARFLLADGIITHNCAIPGVYAPVELLKKDERTGKLSPYMEGDTPIKVR